MFAVRVDPQWLLPEFLSAWTTSEPGRRYFLGCAKQTTNLASINASQVRSAPLVVPPLKVQREIVESLEGLSSVIDVASKLLQEKTRLKRGLMRELITGCRRFPEFTGTSWVDISLRDVLSSTARPVDWNDETVYSLLSVRRRSGGVFLREPRAGKSIRTKGLFTVQEGDFLISRMQVARGALALVGAAFAGMHVAGTYDVLRTRDERVLNIEFFDLLTRLPAMYRRARLACHCVHIEKMTFSLRDYLKGTISVPSVAEEQARIVVTVKVMEDEIKKLEELRILLISQKRALMDQLLSAPSALTR